MRRLNTNVLLLTQCNISALVGLAVTAGLLFGNTLALTRLLVIRRCLEIGNLKWPASL